MTHQRIVATAAATLLLAAACSDKTVIARNDSLQTELNEQQQLATKLSSQKDSLTRIVVDADAFLGKMDSVITSGKREVGSGGSGKRKNVENEPLVSQVKARKEMMSRVNALVMRAKETASQLASLEKANSELGTRNAAQAQKIAEDAQLIADLGATIERQRQEITALGVRLDSLGKTAYKAYYVIGTEKELQEKGIVVKEGGANLLFIHPGRTLVPSRALDPKAFVAIDQRDMKTIPVPDSTRRYRIVSRQSLDATDVPWHDATSFKGDLKITKPDEFWATSRYLILVEM